MLSATDRKTASRRRRSPYSDKQHYQEYILQRIEGYKNSIGRDELLRLGDEAAAELQAASEGQFVLTEVLMLESVDRLIMKRLSLRSYRKWRQQFLKLREAQRTPTHWGIEPDGVLARLLPRIEPEDQVLIVGSGGEPATYLFAAHDATVTFVAADLGASSASRPAWPARPSPASSRATWSTSARRCRGFLDDVTELDLVVLDPGALLGRGHHRSVRARSRPAAAQPARRGPRPPAHLPSLAPEALLSLYDGWELDGVAEAGAAAREPAAGPASCCEVVSSRHALTSAGHVGSTRHAATPAR